MPPCSRPSRTSPPGGPQVGPSLTAAARDGRTFVRAGMEEWLRREPNKRMASNRRAKCRQTRYPDPKPATVHETGASPSEIVPLLSRSKRIVQRRQQIRRGDPLVAALDDLRAFDGNASQEHCGSQSPERV